jgi:hypothetical protein
MIHMMYIYILYVYIFIYVNIYIHTTLLFNEHIKRIRGINLEVPTKWINDFPKVDFPKANEIIQQKKSHPPDQTRPNSTSLQPMVFSIIWQVWWNLRCLDLEFLFLKDQVPLKYRFSAPFLRKVKLRLNQSRLWLKCCPKVKCRTHSGSLISEIDRRLLEWEFHSSCGRHSCKTCLKPNGGAIENGRNLYEKTSCENPTESNCDHSHVRVRDRSCWIFAW